MMNKHAVLKTLGLDGLQEPVLFLTLALLLPTLTSGHGRMWDPPSRQSAWRSKFPMPPNYDDHGMNCGGRVRHWDTNRGLCGVCGDPWNGERMYERPYGRMVQHNVIPTTYRQGQVISATVEVTANHKGWFEFRLCDIATTETKVEATWSCLNRTLLPDASGDTRFYLSAGVRGFVTYKLQLPRDLACAHCMIQWKWHCGNSKGHGIKQEEFYACSDVTIRRSDGATFPTPRPTPPRTTPSTTTTTTTTTTPRTVPTSTPATTTVTTPAPDDNHDEDDDDHMFENFLNYFKKQTKISRGGDDGAGDDDDDDDGDDVNRPDPPDDDGDNSNLFCTLCRFRCNFFGCATRCPQRCPTA